LKEDAKQQAATKVDPKWPRHTKVYLPTVSSAREGWKRMEYNRHCPILRYRGVRSCMLRMFHILGREALYGSSWPLETTLYKDIPKSMLAIQGFRGVHSTVCMAWETKTEERDPASVNEKWRS